VAAKKDTDQKPVDDPKTEDVIEAGLHEDFEPFHAMNAVLADPFTEQPGKEAYAAPAPADGTIHRTFCGT